MPEDDAAPVDDVAADKGILGPEIRAKTKRGYSRQGLTKSKRKKA